MIMQMTKICYEKYAYCLHEQMFLIVVLACVLYPSKLLCFGHFVFVFMGWHYGRNIMYRDPCSGYIKCMKLFFGYSKYNSATSMLLELGLPSFDTLIFNGRVTLSHQYQGTQNGFIAHICALYSVYFCVLFIVCVSVRMYLFVCFFCVSMGLCLK